MYICNYIPIACALYGGIKEGRLSSLSRSRRSKSKGRGGSAQHDYEGPQEKSAMGTARELCTNVFTQRQPHATDTKGCRYYASPFGFN